jgi:hypothetical protein
VEFFENQLCEMENKSEKTFESQVRPDKTNAGLKSSNSSFRNRMSRKLRIIYEMALWHCPWFLLFSMLSLGWYIFELHGTSS